MKKNIIAWFLITLITSTSVGTLVPQLNINEQQTKTTEINPDWLTKVANETSIIPKSLLISKENSFSTNQLINDMWNASTTSSKINLPSANSDEISPFINNLTTNLTYESMVNVQANFINKAADNNPNDAVKKKIGTYQQIQDYLSEKKLNQYFNNQLLSQPAVLSIAEGLINKLKKSPNIAEKVNLINLYPMIQLFLQELTTDWASQSDFDSNPQIAMEKYMNNASLDGKYSQAQQESNWSYVKARAKNWTWNDFYQYIAGVNFNYLIKMLSGKYLGELISDNIVGRSFDDATLIKQIAAAFTKLPETPDAWPFLIKAIVPILKSIPNFLNLKDPTKAVTSICWKATNVDKNILSVSTILQNVINFLDNDSELLKNIIVSILKGNLKFAEDIIINSSIVNNTLPGALDNFFIKFFVNVENIANNLTNVIKNKANKINLSSTLKEVIDFGNQFITTNQNINLFNLKEQINKIFNEKFKEAIKELIDLIGNRNSKSNIAKIFELLGVDKSGSKLFKENSPLFNLSQAINQKDSPIYQMLRLVTNEKRDGIIDNLLKKAESEYHENYINLFDLNNEKAFSIKNVKLIDNIKNGYHQYLLNYELTKLDNKQTFHLSFITNNLQKPLFVMNQFK